MEGGRDICRARCHQYVNANVNNSEFWPGKRRGFGLGRGRDRKQLGGRVYELLDERGYRFHRTRGHKPLRECGRRFSFEAVEDRYWRSFRSKFSMKVIDHSH